MANIAQATVLLWALTISKGGADGLNTASFNPDTSQQTLLTTPRHV